jgi:hypothetical protein
MLLTLLKALNTNKLDVVVANISMSPLDIDVLLYESQDRGDVEIDKKKGTIKALKEPESFYQNPHLYSQICKIVGFYDQQEANITRSRLEMIALDPNGTNGYLRHDFFCTLFALEEDAKVNKYSITVPKRGKRPYHEFEFYTFLDHQEFGAKAVNDFIAQFDKK